MLEWVLGFERKTSSYSYTERTVVLVRGAEGKIIYIGNDDGLDKLTSGK